MDFNAVINGAINVIISGMIGYIFYLFKENRRETGARLARIEAHASEQAEKQQVEVKEIRKDLAVAEQKFYRDFVTREQHDMDVNALMKKLDETNGILREVYKDIGILIGRNRDVK